MSCPPQSAGTWNNADGDPLTRPVPPANLRPPSSYWTERIQWEHDYFVYRMGDYFTRYNQAVFDNRNHPNDPNYKPRAVLSSIVAEYQKYVNNPYVPKELDYCGRGSAMAITNIVVAPNFDNDGFITGFLVEGNFFIGPGTPDDYSSSSSSKRM